MLKFIIREINFIKAKNSLKRAKLVIFDVDGVLTNGKITIDSLGNQYKSFNIKDGLGIKLLQNIGIEVAFISGGKGGATEKRAYDLGVKYCFVGVKNKKKAILDLQNKLDIKVFETIFIGDDLNDIPVKSNVSILLATNDAAKLVKKSANLTLYNNGGDGAVREFAERLLKAKNKWNDIIKKGWLEIND